MIAVAILIFVSLIAGMLLIRREEPKPLPKPSPTPTSPTPITPPALTLRSVEPSKVVEEVPVEYLPRMYPWPLFRSDSANTMLYRGSLPRNLTTLFTVKISVGMEDKTPVVEGDVIFIADEEGIYSLNRTSGELIWGLEIYHDNLWMRAKSHPQPIHRWRAVGLDRFVNSYGLGKYLYVATSDAVDEGHPYILAIDKSSGDIVWRVELVPESGMDVYSSPSSNLVVEDERIFVGDTEGRVFCISEEGVVLWRTSLKGAVNGLAYGGKTLYVSASSATYALSVSNGSAVWHYPCYTCSSPIYGNGAVFVVDGGSIVMLSGRNGSVLWRKNFGAHDDVYEDPYIAVGEKTIYVSRWYGEMPLDLYVVDFNGSTVAKFTLPQGEYPMKPVVSEDVIILPAKCKEKNFDKVYVLWKNGEKLSEVALQRNEEFFPSLADPYPVAIAAYGEIYIFEDPYTIYKLGDIVKPRIDSIKVRLSNIDRTLVVDVEVYDSESAIHRVLLVYSINSTKWVYRDMEVLKRYTVEPVGGYGYRKEVYTMQVEVSAGTMIEFYIVAIDNAGNHVKSSVHAYKVIEGQS
ncbi:MAG: PQQ-binding-like beta-propeller repeat protein [Ignisphaera sp.]|nr:PQQ-binding-like beta-propeller repeat protein [Ignisphaera sp.]